MKIKLALGTALAALVLSQSALANTYTFEYTYDGSSTVTNQSAAGSSFAVGDTVQAIFHAVGGFWQAPAGTYIWTPQELQEAGGRVGDLAWTFSMNGSSVDSGSTSGQTSMYVHIPQLVSTSSAISFDNLTWNYTLTSSDSATNTLAGGTFGFGGSLSPAQFISAVPEPESYAMMLAGLGLLGLIARRRKTA